MRKRTEASELILLAAGQGAVLKIFTEDACCVYMFNCDRVGGHLIPDGAVGAVYYSRYLDNHCANLF